MAEVAVEIDQEGPEYALHGEEIYFDCLHTRCVGFQTQWTKRVHKWNIQPFPGYSKIGDLVRCLEVLHFFSWYFADLWPSQRVVI